MLATNEGGNQSSSKVIRGLITGTHHARDKRTVEPSGRPPDLAVNASTSVMTCHAEAMSMQ